MASENLQIGENGRNVLGAITNDVSQFIKNLRVNPVTGRLLVDANVTSTNTSIGSTIPGGTAGSILFLGAGSTLAQDNANLFYDDTNNFVGLGTNTPSATLDIIGTFQYVDGNQTAGYVLTSDGSGNATWQLNPANAGYDTIQNQGVSVTQRNTINLSNLLTASDVASKTALTINVANLATDSTFITDLLGNNTFMSGIANNATFITALTTNSTFLSDLATSTTFIDDLIANTYFTMNLANNATFISTLTNNVTFQGDIISIVNNPATNPSAGKVFVDNTDTTLGYLYDKLVAGTNITLTVNNVAGNETITIDATGGGGSGTDLTSPLITQANSFSTGDVIRVDNTGTFVPAQADSAINSEAVGIVVSATGADFTYVSSAVQLATSVTGTPGDALFLDPSVAGGITTTKPTAVGQIVRGLGTLIASGSLMYFDIAALAEEITSASGGGASTAEQNLGGFNGTANNNTFSPECTTSSADGQTLFAAFYDQNGNTYTVCRFQKDANTGEFYLTDTANTGTSSDGTNAGLAIVGSYVYLSFQGHGGLTGKLQVDRFDLADLANETLMTTGDPSMTNWNGMFTDGTDLYISLADTVFTQYTISGTTITSGGTLTGGLSGTSSPFYDGTNVFMIDPSTLLVNSYTFGGGSFTLINANTFGQLDLANGGTTGIGFCNIDSTDFFVANNTVSTVPSGGGTAYHSNLIIKAFSKPI